MPRWTNKKDTRRTPREQQPRTHITEPWASVAARGADNRRTLEPVFAATDYTPACRDCGTTEGLTVVYKPTSAGFVPTDAVCATCGPVRHRPAPSWVEVRSGQGGPVEDAYVAADTR